MKTLDFNTLTDCSYMIHLMEDADRLELEKIIFDYHKMKFPNIFDAYTVPAECKSPSCNSFHELIRYAKSMKLPYILVFEDDAYPCNGIVEKLKEYIKDIPDDCMLLQLGWSKNLNDRKSIFNKISNPCYCIQSSIIFEEGYDAILKLLESKYSMDCLQSQLNSSYVVNIPLFIQYNFNHSVFKNLGYDIRHFSNEDLEFFHKNFSTVDEILEWNYAN